jgi:hypothetical protein
MTRGPRKKPQPPARPDPSRRNPVFGPRATLVSLVVIAAIALAFFGRVLFLREVLTGGDVLAAALIFEKHAEQEIAAGRLPLWNPHIFSGMPFYDSMSWNAVVYPTYWIKTALQAIPGVILPRLTFLVLHYILAGFGMFFFLRARSVGHGGAVVGAVAFMLTPHLVGLATIGHGGKILTAAYIPLILMSAQKVMDTGERRWVAALALLGGLQFLARHVQVSYYTWLIVALFLVYQLAARPAPRLAWPVAARRAGAVACAAVLAALLAAVLLIPLREYAALSTRTATGGGMGFEQATMWSFHPSEIITFFVPSFFGLADETYWGTMPFQQVSHYMGYLVLVLAAIAVVRKRGHDVAFLAVLFAFGIVLAFGKHFGPLYRLVYETLPGFDRFRVPALFLLVAQFAAAALAGHGASTLLGEEGRDRGRWTPWAVGAAGLGIAIGLAVIASKARLTESASIALMTKHAGVQAALLRSIGAKAAGMAFRDGGILVVMAAAAGVSVLVAGARKLPAVLPAALLLGLVVWDIGIVDARFMRPTPMQPLASYYPETPAVRFLKSQPPPFRILPLGEEFSSNAYMYHGLESVGGYHPAKLAVYDDLLTAVGMTNLKLLAMLNVKYVVGPEQLDHPAFRKVAPGVHEFLGALPRAFLVGRIEKVPSENAALNMFGIDSFDPGTTAAIVEELPGPVESPDGGTVDVVSWEAERLEVRASAPRPCLLVFSEIYYAPGWKAFVDGTETRIYRTDHAFRSVYLEPGTHTIVMSYAGDAIRLGLVISLCAAVVIAALWAVPARRRGRA